MLQACHIALIAKCERGSLLCNVYAGILMALLAWRSCAGSLLLALHTCGFSIPFIGDKASPIRIRVHLGLCWRAAAVNAFLFGHHTLFFKVDTVVFPLESAPYGPSDVFLSVGEFSLPA